MTIWWECGEDVKWHSKLYDKKIGMIAKGLKLNRFPHPKSKLSRRCKYGVITSQLHRYKVACTQNKHFLEPALSLYSAYLHKGFKVNIVDRYFERFIRSKIPGVRPNAVKQLYEQEQISSMSRKQLLIKKSSFLESNKQSKYLWEQAGLWMSTGQ